MKTSIIFLFFPFISAGFSQSWNHTYNGTASSEDMANQVVIDNLGNVYVTGTGSGSFNDYVTIKYDISGMQQWVAYYKGFDPLLNNDDRATSIAVDDAGNVYVTGFSEKQTISDAFDIATVKYNSSGVQQWATRYDPLNVCSKAFSIAVDNFTGSVYVTGEIGAAGPSTCAQGDCITIKYNSGGVQQWVNIYNYNDGIDKGNQIAVDGGGNAYVTGESQSGNGLDYDYITIKYNLTGVQQWVSRYNGSGNGNDKSHSIAVDRYGNGVYVTGESVETGGKVAITSIKYDYSGLQEWIAHYLPPVNQFAVGTFKGIVAAALCAGYGMLILQVTALAKLIISI